MPKRASDLNQLAKRLVDEATGEKPITPAPSESAQRVKSPRNGFWQANHASMARPLWLEFPSEHERKGTNIFSHYKCSSASAISTRGLALDMTAHILLACANTRVHK